MLCPKLCSKGHVYWPGGTRALQAVETKKEMTALRKSHWCRDAHSVNYLFDYLGSESNRFFEYGIQVATKRIKRQIDIRTRALQEVEEHGFAAAGDGSSVVGK